MRETNQGRGHLNSGAKNEKDDSHIYLWSNAFIRRRDAQFGTGKTSANAHRRVSVRELSVQHPEGREPSRLRTETERDRSY
jgi:hypothetical protein